MMASRGRRNKKDEEENQPEKNYDLPKAGNKKPAKSKKPVAEEKEEEEEEELGAAAAAAPSDKRKRRPGVGRKKYGSPGSSPIRGRNLNLEAGMKKAPKKAAQLSDFLSASDSGKESDDLEKPKPLAPGVLHHELAALNLGGEEVQEEENDNAVYRALRAPRSPNRNAVPNPLPGHGMDNYGSKAGQHSDEGNDDDDYDDDPMGEADEEPIDHLAKVAAVAAEAPLRVYKQGAGVAAKGVRRRHPAGSPPPPRAQALPLEPDSEPIDHLARVAAVAAEAPLRVYKQGAGIAAKVTRRHHHARNSPPSDEAMSLESDTELDNSAARIEERKMATKRHKEKANVQSDDSTDESPSKKMLSEKEKRELRRKDAEAKKGEHSKNKEDSDEDNRYQTACTNMDRKPDGRRAAAGNLPVAAWPSTSGSTSRSDRTINRKAGTTTTTTESDKLGKILAPNKPNGVEARGLEIVKKVVSSVVHDSDEDAEQLHSSLSSFGDVSNEDEDEDEEEEEEADLPELEEKITRVVEKLLPVKKQSSRLLAAEATKLADKPVVSLKPVKKVVASVVHGSDEDAEQLHSSLSTFGDVSNNNNKEEEEADLPEPEEKITQVVEKLLPVKKQPPEKKQSSRLLAAETAKLADKTVKPVKKAAALASDKIKRTRPAIQRKVKSPTQEEETEGRTRPTTLEMICEAITLVDEPKGASVQAIKKVIVGKYGMQSSVLLKKAISKGFETGQICRPRKETDIPANLRGRFILVKPDKVKPIAQEVPKEKAKGSKGTGANGKKSPNKSPSKAKPKKPVTLAVQPLVHSNKMKRSSLAGSILTKVKRSSLGKTTPDEDKLKLTNGKPKNRGRPKKVN